jgi:hypothetical protein
LLVSAFSVFAFRFSRLRPSRFDVQGSGFNISAIRDPPSAILAAPLTSDLRPPSSCSFPLPGNARFRADHAMLARVKTGQQIFDAVIAVPSPPNSRLGKNSPSLSLPSRPSVTVCGYAVLRPCLLAAILAFEPFVTAVFGFISERRTRALTRYASRRPRGLTILSGTILSWIRGPGLRARIILSAMVLPPLRPLSVIFLFSFSCHWFALHSQLSRGPVFALWRGFACLALLRPYHVWRADGFRFPCFRFLLLPPPPFKVQGSTFRVQCSVLPRVPRLLRAPRVGFPDLFEILCSRQIAPTCAKSRYSPTPPGGSRVWPGSW